MPVVNHSRRLQCECNHTSRRGSCNLHLGATVVFFSPAHLTTSLIKTKWNKTRNSHRNRRVDGCTGTQTVQLHLVLFLGNTSTPREKKCLQPWLGKSVSNHGWALSQVDTGWAPIVFSSCTRVLCSNLGNPWARHKPPRAWALLSQSLKQPRPRISWR